MIINASNTNLSTASSHLPNLSRPITKWFLDITFTILTKVAASGEVTETGVNTRTKGVVQNLDSKQLQVKPEAQRAWTWKMIHCLPDLQLDVDDILVYNDINYRVMNVKDYSEYGYMEYHIVQGYNS
jgi:hypothetical protein